MPWMAPCSTAIPRGYSPIHTHSGRVLLFMTLALTLPLSSYSQSQCTDFITCSECMLAPECCWESSLGSCLPTLIGKCTISCFPSSAPRDSSGGYLSPQSSTQSSPLSATSTPIFSPLSGVPAILTPSPLAPSPNLAPLKVDPIPLPTPSFIPRVVNSPALPSSTSVPVPLLDSRNPALESEALSSPSDSDSTASPDPTPSPTYPPSPRAGTPQTVVLSGFECHDGTWVFNADGTFILPATFSSNKYFVIGNATAPARSTTVFQDAEVTLNGTVTLSTYSMLYLQGQSTLTVGGNFIVKGNSLLHLEMNHFDEPLIHSMSCLDFGQVRIVLNITQILETGIYRISLATYNGHQCSLPSLHATSLSIDSQFSDPCIVISHTELVTTDQGKLDVLITVTNPCVLGSASLDLGLFWLFFSIKFIFIYSQYFPE